MKIRIRIGGFLLLLRTPPLTRQQQFTLIGAFFSLFINLVFLGSTYFLIAEPEKPKILNESERAILLRLLEDPDVQKARELMENPPADNQKPDDAKIASDRDATSDIKEIPDALKNSQNVAVVGNPDPGSTDKSVSEGRTEEDRFKNNMTIQPFLKSSDRDKSVMERLTGKQDPTQQGMQGQTYELNTYQWEFAPYMLKWKNKMTDNWYKITSKINFSPFASVGQIQVYVKMDRKGQLLDSKLIGYNCDKSFVAPAYASVLNAFPLDPLPLNFPDQFLETTWTISITNN